MRRILLLTFAIALTGSLSLLATPGSTVFSSVSGLSWDADAAVFVQGHDMNLSETRAFLRKKFASQPKVADELAAQLVKLCRHYELNVGFILALIQAESRFKTNALSNRGAVGLMQVQPATALYLAKKYGLTRFARMTPHQMRAELAKPVSNIAIGVAYIDYLKSKFSNYSEVLSAYNLGPTKYRIARSTAAFGKFSKVHAYVAQITKNESKVRLEGQLLAAN